MYLLIFLHKTCISGILSGIFLVFTFVKQNIDGEKAENLIYTVLRQRHLKEAIHLEDQLAREMAAARRRAKAEVEQNRQKEREMLLSAFEQVQFLCFG